MVSAAFDLARQKPLTVTGMLQHIFFSLYFSSCQQKVQLPGFKLTLLWPTVCLRLISNAV